jgi:hypothetical protein
MNQAIPMGSDFMPQAENVANSGGSLLLPIIGIVVFAVVIAMIAYKVFLD